MEDTNNLKPKPKGKETLNEEIFIKFEEPINVYNFFVKLLVHMGCTELDSLKATSPATPSGRLVNINYLAIGGKFKNVKYDEELITIDAEFSVPIDKYKSMSNTNTGQYKADEISLYTSVLPEGSIVKGLNKIIADDKSPYKIIETKDTLYNSVR